MLHDIGLVDWVNCRGKFLLVRGVASYSYVVPRATTTTTAKRPSTGNMAIQGR